MMHVINNKKDGFTLLEVLIAMAIFSFGVLALVAMNIAVIKSNYKSKNMTIAVDLAQDKLDEVMNTAYNLVVASSEYALDEEGVPGSGLFDRNVVLTSTNIDPDYKEIEVTISWSDPQSRQITLATIVSE